MKLHEAIAQILRDKGTWMTTTEIASSLNSNKIYQKKDSSLITAYQIHGRTKNYSHLFKRDGVKVKLQSSYPIPLSKPESLIKREYIKPVAFNTSTFDKYLLGDIYFKPAHSVDDLVPANKCGVYCIRINNLDALPTNFKKMLIERNHDILYFGIASKCLKTRFLNQELRIKGHGTFIRNIGAILGYRPLKGSLNARKNKRNYTFSNEDNKAIIKWINENLIVNWIVFYGDLNNVESALIKAYKPLLNISKNDFALSELQGLRSICVNIANS